MDWDAAAALIAVSVSTLIFFFAMWIVRLDIARSKQEMEHWKSDMDLVTVHQDLVKKADRDEYAAVQRSLDARSKK